MKSLIKKPLAFLICASSFSFADSSPSDVNVSLKQNSELSHIITVVFKNRSKSDFWLSRYNFCQKGVIFQNLFQVTSSDSKSEASYAGVTDFVGQGTTDESGSIKLLPDTAISCEVDLSRYYFTRGQAKFYVKYASRNPGFKGQKPEGLVSNEIEVLLPATSDSSNGPQKNE